MVCAPSNKAVNVIAKRFLQTLENFGSNVPCNVIVIGVRDKILEDDSNNLMNRSFAYTWLDYICNELSDISMNIGNQFFEVAREHNIQRIQFTRDRLKANISSLLEDQQVLVRLDRVVDFLNDGDPKDDYQCSNELEAAVAALRWLDSKIVIRTLMSKGKRYIFVLLTRTTLKHFINYKTSIENSEHYLLHTFYCWVLVCEIY